jgi:tetratricopeptide (TPR) repeat protein
MEKLLEFLKDEDHFVRPTTLILGIITILITEASLDNFVKEFVTPGHKRRLALYLSIQAIFIAAWLYKRYVFPRVPKGKVGLVIAVTTESEKSRTRLRVDLVGKLKETIGETSLQSFVHVILLNNHQSKRLSKILIAQRQNILANREHGEPLHEKIEAAWNRVKRRIRGRGFIFGQITERLAGENTIYILESHAFVTMPPVAEEVQRLIDKDFGQIWTHRIHIEEKAEFMGFPLSGDLMFIPVAYIMGIVALISRDIFTALKFHNTLMGRTEPLRNLPEIAEVRKKLISTLSEENVLAARYYQAKQDIHKLREHLAKALALNANCHMALVFKSIVDFSIDNNPFEALNTIRRSQKTAGVDGTWRYNEAFLLMHLEQFDKALALYREISKYQYEGEEVTLSEVYKFNEEHLQQHPEKIQSHFIIGYLKFKKSGNLGEALDFLEAFLIEAQRKGGKYKNLVREATVCLNQIKQKMNLAG